MPPQPLQAAFPSGPLTEAGTQQPTSAWRAFFMALYARTGDAGGVDAQALTATDNALSVRDDQLASEITAEASTRAAADNAEKTARTAADAALQASTLPLTGGTLSGPLVAPAVTATLLQVGSVTGPTWRTGNGAPTYSAPRGSLYSRQDGAVGSTLYVCQSGTSWNAVAAV